MPPEQPALPPVVAPSGRFIAQLFLVPGLIVASAIVVLLGFSWLAGGNRTPEAFLRDLESSNPDIRWRTASDLAQVLRRDPGLASNADFGLKLATILKQSLGELERAEASQAAAGAQSAEATARERKESQARQAYVQYLIASLGNLMTPAGAPLLGDIARKSGSRDPKTDAIMRRQALWALAALGDNLQKFSTLPEEQQDATRRQLEQALNGAGDSGEWARRSLNYLQKSGPLGAIDSLVACSRDDDPFLRKEAALALSFWFGTAEENQKAEAALVTLAQDDGHGTTISIREGD